MHKQGGGWLSKRGRFEGELVRRAFRYTADRFARVGGKRIVVLVGRRWRCSAAGLCVLGRSGRRRAVVQRRTAALRAGTSFGRVFGVGATRLTGIPTLARCVCVEALIIFPVVFVDRRGNRCVRVAACSVSSCAAFCDR